MLSDPSGLPDVEAIVHHDAALGYYRADGNVIVMVLHIDMMVALRTLRRKKQIEETGRERVAESVSPALSQPMPGHIAQRRQQGASVWKNGGGISRMEGQNDGD